ncbi:MAG TPA: ATP-binding protein [Vicinamibacterales bacterium]|nr:ATP-binding protein [Vicinamibacterales bacterium]
MPPSNPFVYGEIVPASAFVGRADELGRLTADLADGQKIFLISPRRYGKSSLVHQAFRTLQRRNVVTLEFTVSSFSSYVGFLEGYARALVNLDARTPRSRSWLRELFGGVTPEVRVEPGGGAGVAIAFPGIRTPRDAARLADEVFALPARIAARGGRRLAIALDEFQAIGSFGGAAVEPALRAAVQQQRQVGYVFAGSEPSLMEAMIGPRRPFYKAGPVLRLRKIPAETFASFVDTRFAKSGLAPENGLGAAVVDLSGNLPYDVQRLAHETWDDVAAARQRRVGLEDLHATLHRLLGEQEPMFEAIWQKLTLGQRAVLRAVVLERGRELLAVETRDRHRLGGASTVQAALAALVREDLIAREEDGHYAVVDSLMREWVARRTY